jgi:hypothetical protein
VIWLGPWNEKILNAVPSHTTPIATPAANSPPAKVVPSLAVIGSELSGATVRVLGPVFVVVGLKNTVIPLL